MNSGHGPQALISDDAGPDVLERSLLRFITCGSVDDGKSTLVGRLLLDTQQILDDQLAKLERDSLASHSEDRSIDLALIVDGLEAEREQGITIDVAYRYFRTPRRAFILADTPGHEHYTRNMATGASNCDLAIILVDARKGVLVQTKRHAFICGLLGIKSYVLAINKLDLVGYDQGTFKRIADEFRQFASQMGLVDLVAIPISARYGDNVASRSGNTPWYDGRALIEHLESVDNGSNILATPFRFSVQRVNRPNLDFRGLCGSVGSGSVSVGDAVVAAVSGRASSIARILTADGDLKSAYAGEAVTLLLADEIDVARGDLLADPVNRPTVSDQFAAHVIWMSEEHLLPGRSYLMRIGCKWVPATITLLKHKIDVNSLQQLAARDLKLNEIAFCNINTAMPVAFDAYADNRETGAFILVDRVSNATVAAGMISFGLRRATNIYVEELFVDKSARAAAKHQKATVIWFTGLSGSGKSTIAKRLEKRLHESGNHTYVLDGDNVRHGLNRDLGFTDADRVENIRRIGEVAKLFVDAGLIAICSFISPFQAERRLIREMMDEGEFVEVFVDASIDECRRRDPKGLYAKADAGKIKNFTGIDSPYEAPESPEVHLTTERRDADQLVTELIDYLQRAGRI